MPLEVSCFVTSFPTPWNLDLCSSILSPSAVGMMENLEGFFLISGNF